MPSIRGPSVAEPLWSWGGEEMNSSVFGSFEPKQYVCVYDYMLVDACMWTSVWLHVFLPSAHMLILCSCALMSSPNHFAAWTSKYLSFCLEFIGCFWVSGTLRPPDRRPMRKGRSGWDPIQQGAFRTQRASPHCLHLELPARLLENTTTPTCVSL